MRYAINSRHHPIGAADAAPLVGLFGDHVGILRALLVVPVLLIPALALVPVSRPPAARPPAAEPAGQQAE